MERHKKIPRGLYQRPCGAMPEGISKNKFILSHNRRAVKYRIRGENK